MEKKKKKKANKTHPILYKYYIYVYNLFTLI
jgi:hypothetical protein